MAKIRESVIVEGERRLVERELTAEETAAFAAGAPPAQAPTYSSREIRRAFSDAEMDEVLASDDVGVRRFVLMLSTMGDHRTAADGASFVGAVAYLDSLGLAPQALKDMARP